MTVAEMLSRLSSFELSEWMAHDELTALEIEHAQNHAQARQSMK